MKQNDHKHAEKLSAPCLNCAGRRDPKGCKDCLAWVRD